MRRLCFTWQTPPAQRNILETLNSETKFRNRPGPKLSESCATCSSSRPGAPSSACIQSLGRPPLCFFEIPYLRGRNPLDSGPPLLAAWAARHYARPGDGFPSHGSSGRIAPLTFALDHRHHRRQSLPRAARHCPAALLTSWRQNYAHQSQRPPLGLEPGHSDR